MRVRCVGGRTRQTLTRTRKNADPATRCVRPLSVPSGSQECTGEASGVKSRHAHAVGDDSGSPDQIILGGHTVPVPVRGEG